MTTEPYRVISRTERASARKAAVALGNFDGVHRGHAAVLSLLARRARESEWTALAVTFHPHPGVVLGRGAPALLTTLARRAELVRALGVELCVCPFDAELASWPPERFVEELLVGALGVRLVVVGEDFHFGARRAGDLELLRTLGAKLAFAAEPAPTAGDDRGPFSSSRAREALRIGDVGEAARVLGRPHSFAGTVGRGAERGRTIGFPTANLEGILEMLPPRGVYAVDVSGVDAARRLRGVMNVGVRPTVAGDTETCEVHVLDWRGDLYGRELRVELIARVRDERKFASLEDLAAQIQKDVVAARAAQRYGT